MPHATAAEIPWAGVGDRRDAATVVLSPSVHRADAAPEQVRWWRTQRRGTAVAYRVPAVLR